MQSWHLGGVCCNALCCFNVSLASCGDSVQLLAYSFQLTTLKESGLGSLFKHFGSQFFHL